MPFNLLMAGVDKALPIDDPFHLKGWYSKGLLCQSKGFKNNFSFQNEYYIYKEPISVEAETESIRFYLMYACNSSLVHFDSTIISLTGTVNLLALTFSICSFFFLV